MGRPRIVVAPEEAREMFRLFEAGYTTRYVGKQTGYSARVVQRTLRVQLGPLWAARTLLRASKERAAQLGYVDTSLEYREGFEAGYRMAVTQAKLHGLERAWTYWNRSLLPWRDDGRYAPPPFSVGL